MTIYNPEGAHRYYTEQDRHFSSKSELFTGADSLVTAQRNGWELVGLAYRQHVTFGGNRSTTLYHFELRKNGERMRMPVLSNPFVEKMLQTHRIRVLITQSLPKLEINPI